jgi:hypothetical protein
MKDFRRLHESSNWWFQEHSGLIVLGLALFCALAAISAPSGPWSHPATGYIESFRFCDEVDANAADVRVISATTSLNVCGHLVLENTSKVICLDVVVWRSDRSSAQVEQFCAKASQDFQISIKPDNLRWKSGDYWVEMYYRPLPSLDARRDFKVQ